MNKIDRIIEYLLLKHNDLIMPIRNLDKVIKSIIEYEDFYIKEKTMRGIAIAKMNPEKYKGRQVGSKGNPQKIIDKNKPAVECYKQGLGISKTSSITGKSYNSVKSLFKILDSRGFSHNGYNFNSTIDACISIQELKILRKKKRSKSIKDEKIKRYSEEEDRRLEKIKSNKLKIKKEKRRKVLFEKNIINIAKTNIAKIESDFRLNDGFKTYIIFSNNTNLYKIGKSKDIKNRFKTISALIPGKITLMAYCELNYENILHREYCNYRKHSEWFKLSNEQVEEIIKKYKFDKYLN